MNDDKLTMARARDIKRFFAIGLTDEAIGKKYASVTLISLIRFNQDVIITKEVEEI